MKWYIYTLDSHDAFGPFVSYDAALAWAKHRQLSSFQVLNGLPYNTTIQLKAY